MDNITLKEKELYQEVDLYVDDKNIGSAEIEIKSKMLCRLEIMEPYQNLGYGKQVVKLLTEKYGCDCLWVKADNEKAIHVYELNGYKKAQPTMYLMKRE